MRLAFVVPRYGEDVVGGAETLSRGLAEHLPKDRYNVEILTTCARSHFRWDNYYPEGDSLKNGLKVKRFKVNRRDLNNFSRIQQEIEQGIRPSMDEQLLWAKEGVNSDCLYDYIWRKGKNYDYLIFLPYLFGTTFWGSQICPEISILIPCLHDETYARLDIFKIVFEKVKGIIFNSEPERSLARRLFQIMDKPTAVVGMGFEENKACNPDSFRKRYSIKGDYILYYGRKEGGKNLPLLIDYFSCLKRGHRAFTSESLKLILAGDGDISIPEDMKGEIVELGFLSEGDKMNAVKGAFLVCQPSVNESFSIVIMEAWLTGTPVLVHGDCDVTKGHVLESGGGLYFRNYYEFSEAVKYLLENPEVCKTLGLQGKRYVLDKYSWPAVIKRFDGALNGFR